MEDSLPSNQRVILKFEYYTESNSIGVYDQAGFLGSIMTQETLWTIIKEESEIGPGYTRLKLENRPFERRPGEPDFKYIEQVFKELDEKDAFRRQIKKDPSKLTIDDLELNVEEFVSE